MTGDDWQKIGEVAAYALLGGLVTYKAHRAEMQAKKAKENAASARDFSEPTGNGFAKYVKDSLACLQESATDQRQATERIELRQSQSDNLLYDHIRAHANADVMKGAHRESASDPNSP